MQLTLFNLSRRFIAKHCPRKWNISSLECFHWLIKHYWFCFSFFFFFSSRKPPLAPLSDAKCTDVESSCPWQFWEQLFYITDSSPSKPKVLCIFIRSHRFFLWLYSFFKKKKNVLWLGKTKKKIFFGKWSHWKDKGRQRSCSSVERADITPTLTQRTLFLWFNLWVLLNNVTWIQASATMSLFLIFIIVSDLPEATNRETAGWFCSVSFSY